MAGPKKAGGRRKAAKPTSGTIEVEAVTNYSGGRIGTRGKGSRFFYDYDGDPLGLRAKGYVVPVVVASKEPDQGEAQA
jgi:hypothetical protein